jgi:carboxylesterase type B
LDPPIASIREKSAYDRIEKLFGDMEMNAAHRLLCESFSQAATCYAYRFDAIAGDAEDPRRGVVHSSEVDAVLQLSETAGYRHRSSFYGKSQAYYDLASLMSTMWAGFIVTLDPNAGLDGDLWPKYKPDKPQNIVFNETGPFWTENNTDADRVAAMAYLGDIMQGILEK